MSKKILELVVFELLAGVDEASFLANAEAVSEWARAQSGFISRDLSRSEDGGRWIEVVWWETPEDAQRAARLAESSEECAPMFAQIDVSRATMRHGVPALSHAA